LQVEHWAELTHEAQLYGQFEQVATLATAYKSREQTQALLERVRLPLHDRQKEELAQVAH
jgi:hypothetical protein